MGMMDFITSYFTSLFSRKPRKEQTKDKVLQKRTTKTDDNEQTKKDENMNMGQTQNTIVFENTNYEIIFDESVILNNYIQEQIKQPQKPSGTNLSTDIFKKVKRCSINNGRPVKGYGDNIPQTDGKQTDFVEMKKRQNKKTTNKVVINEHKNMKNKATVKFQEKYVKKENKREDARNKKSLKMSTLLTPKSSKNNKQKRSKKLKAAVGRLKKKKIPMTLKRKKTNNKLIAASDDASSSEIAKSLSEIDICLNKREVKDFNEHPEPDKSLSVDKKEDEKNLSKNITALSSLDHVEVSNYDCLNTCEDNSSWRSTCNTLETSFKENINNKIKSKQSESKEDYKNKENITKASVEEIELDSDINYETKKSEIDSLLSKLEFPIEHSDLKIEEIDFNDIKEIPWGNIKKVESEKSEYINLKSLAKQRNKVNLYETAIDSLNKVNSFKTLKTVIPEITRDEKPSTIGDFIIPDWALDKSQYTKEQDIKELIAYFKDEVEEIWEVFPTYDNLDSPNKLSKRIIKK